MSPHNCVESTHAVVHGRAYCRECGALVHLDLDGGQGRSPDDVAEQAGAWTGVLLLLIAMAAVAWGMSCL